MNKQLTLINSTITSPILVILVSRDSPGAKEHFLITELKFKDQFTKLETLYSQLDTKTPTHRHILHGLRMCVSYDLLSAK